MKNTSTLYLALIFITIQLSVSVSAQSLATNPPVLIKNNSGETRKICMHKPKTITLFAIGCVELKRGESIYWNRKGVFTPFKVKIYKVRKILDKYLFTRDLPADTGKIIIGKGGRFGFSRFKNIRTKYSLRACNQRFDDTVYFTLGLETNYGFWTEGWWGVKKGKCINVNVSDRLKDKHNVPFGTKPDIHYFARSYGKKRLTWSGGEGDYSLCIDPKSAFNLLQFRQSGTGKYDPLPCSAETRKRVSFRRLKEPAERNSVFYLTF